MMNDDEIIRENDPTIAYRHDPLSDDGAGPRVAGAFGYALVVEGGPRAGLAFILAPGKTTIGRAEDANIFFDDVTVSRRHASVVVEGEALTISDEGSLNGTYVNGERVDEAQLSPGDEVIVGKYHLVVARGDD